MNRVDRSQNLRRWAIRTRYNAATDALGWNSGDVARRLGCTRTLTENWRQGIKLHTPPQCVIEWLEALALHRAADPQPPKHWRRPRGPKPGQSSA